MSILKTIYLQHLNGANANMTLDSSGRVGIGNTSPSFPLHVGGEIFSGRTDSSSEGGQLSLGRASDNFAHYNIDCYGGSTTPSLRFIDAAVGAVRMDIDSSGRVTMPYQPAFRVEYTSGVAIAAGAVIVWNTIILNDGGCYSNSTGRFTAPVTGKYLFSVSLLAGNASAYGIFNFRVNGSQVAPINGAGYQMYVSQNNDRTLTASPIIKMNAGDYLDVYVYNPHNSFYASGYNSFSGILLS